MSESPQSPPTSPSKLVEDPRMIPGDHPENCPSNLLEPRGKADGVIYFKDAPGKTENEREALRYLRPMPSLWKIETKQLGVSRPYYIRWMFPKDLVHESKSHEISWMFTCDPWCIGAARDGYSSDRTKWEVKKAKDGVWLVFYNKG